MWKTVPPELAEVRMRMRGDGTWELEAECGSARAVAVTEKCPLCAADVFGGVHPHNGCVKVVVQEVMET